ISHNVSIESPRSIERAERRRPGRMGASHTMDKWEVQFAAEFAQNTPSRNVGAPAFPAFCPVRFISPAGGGDGERSDAREGKSPRLAQRHTGPPPPPPPPRRGGKSTPPP